MPAKYCASVTDFDPTLNQLQGSECGLVILVRGPFCVARIFRVFSATLCYTRDDPRY